MAAGAPSNSLLIHIKAGFKVPPYTCERPNTRRRLLPLTIPADEALLYVSTRTSRPRSYITTAKANSVPNSSLSNPWYPLANSLSNMSNRIALILGSGAGLGSHVASRLRNEGYRVATVSRSLKDKEENGETAMALECDLADPTGVEKVFERVRGAWGEPSVVVYNGTTAKPYFHKSLHALHHTDPSSQRTLSPAARPPRQLWTSPQRNSSSILPSTPLRRSSQRVRR